MLIPAMAFAWCVLSAQAEKASALRAAATVANSAPTEAAATDAPTTTDAPTAAAATAAAHLAGSEVRAPIRTAIPLAVIAFAKTLVNLPMGAEQVAEIAGQRYVFVLEHHYHPPGFVGGPNGWHKGVTAYELKGAAPTAADTALASSVPAAEAQAALEPLTP